MAKLPPMLEQCSQGVAFQTCPWHNGCWRQHGAAAPVVSGHHLSQDFSQCLFQNTQGLGLLSVRHLRVNVFTARSAVSVCLREKAGHSCCPSEEMLHSMRKQQCWDGNGTHFQNAVSSLDATLLKSVAFVGRLLPKSSQ